MAAEEKQEMGAGAAPGEKGPATADKAENTGATEEEKGDAAADKEKGSTAEKEEKGATAGNEEEEEGEEEEERATAEQKGENRSASATRGHKKKAGAEEMEGMFTWFSEIALSEKGTAAAERKRRERRRFRRTKGQRPEKKGAMADSTGEVAGKKEIFFFKASAVITLESSDGMLFMVSEEAARLSVLLADMIDQDGAGGIIQLPNVDARALDMVIKYCNKHADAAYANRRVDEGSSCCNSEASGEALKEWDSKLIDGLSQDALSDVIITAKFLHIKGLLDAACQKVAVEDMVNCKTRGQMHQIEKEDMCTWFSGLTFSEKGTAAAEGARRERRRFKRTKVQRPEKKGAMAEETEHVAGENDTFFFRASGKIITLKSSDGMLFKVSEAAARLSVLLADMIDQGCAGGIIPLPNVDARALATVIEYCNKRADAHAASANSRVDESSSSNSEASGEALMEWDHKLVDGLSQDALYDLIMAANFLHIKGLLDAGCQKVADMVKGYSVEQMRKMFGIANDFTEEEEEELRKESPWAFEE